MFTSPQRRFRWIALPLLAVAFVLSIATSALQAQTCGVPGVQGFVTLAGTAVNSYFAGTGSPGAGATSITLATGTNANRGATATLLAGDLVLIIQMQDSSGGLEGNYEYGVVTVGGGVGATVQLASALTKSYAQSVAVGTIRTYQVVRVPQYSAATLSGTVNVLPWFVEPTNGFGTGGVYAVDVAGGLTLNGVTINANGKGFRGGRAINSSANRAGGTPFDADYACVPATLNGGFKGEGTEGIPQQVFGWNIGATTGAGQTYDAAGQVFNGGQGYPAGSCGQAAKGNAGGGSNDGVPPTETNGTNSGGGGGSNAAAGGIGGNSWNQNDYTAAHSNPTSVSGTGLGGFDAGGRGGGTLAAAYASRIFLGGGGGAGSANNGSADSVTTMPPTPSSVAANGAAGSITSSGAPGGGIVIMRAGTLAVSAASVINAQGLRAYNKAPVGDTDAGGGGGGGGTIIMDTPGTGAIASLTLNAFGGAGGSSPYYNHGPGGGGGGGYVATSFTGATIDVTGGIAGFDSCCGGPNSNGSPKNYRAAAGSNATASTGVSGLLPPGSPASARCLPNLTVTKLTTTPLITAFTGATASYTINVSNAGGAATNVFIFDATLPPGWVYRTATPAPAYSYAPAPPFATNNFAAGAETTAATGVAAPPVLPVNSATVVNSVTAVSLRAAAAAPGVVPTAGAGSLTFGSFFIPQNGSISVTFAVTIPNTATVGVYHNPAGVVYLDPTRNAAGVRMVAPAANVNANRTGVAYSANTSFQSGGTTTIPGSHFNGLVAGPTTEDVELIAELSITKTAPATAAVGSTFTYTLTPRNAGRGLGTMTFAATQATDLPTASDVGALIGASPLAITDTMGAGMRMTTTFAGGGWACSGTTTAVCTLADTLAYPRAASTNFPTLSGVVSPTCGGGNVKTNTVEISTVNNENTKTNNISTVTTTISPACGTSTLTVSKASTPTGTLLTASTVSYTITVANLGPSAAPGTILVDPANPDLTCSTVSCTVTGGTASCPASPTVAQLQSSTGLTITPTFNANSSLSFVVTCTVNATGF
ncbi:MAG: hypothetical protein ABI907_01540 [Ramlibacter sp.]